jgi:aquaporin Z
MAAAPRPFADALRRHWPEYLIEASLLGLFMVSACGFGTLLGHPSSPVTRAIADANLRRLLMGLCMGLTALALIYSPLGRRSGAHMNPSVTLTFLRLKKVERHDALFYALAQFAGGVAGVLFMRALLGERLAHPAVRFAATVPGMRGVAVAFAAEAVISFLLMLTVLSVSNVPRYARFTGCVAACLVASYISLEEPLSGMSMNPARTFGSAVVAGEWNSLWVYFTAPPLGMLAAGEVFVRAAGLRRVLCAKLHHDDVHRCIFFCGPLATRRADDPADVNEPEDRAGSKPATGGLEAASKHTCRAPRHERSERSAAAAT